MMLVSVPENETQCLRDALSAIEDLHTTSFETSDPRSVEITPQVVYNGRLKLSGADNPGIVHQVTSLIARNGLSIDELETSDEEAPFGGTTLFIMEGVVTAVEPVGGKVNIKDVQEQLANLANNMNCDITLEEIVEDEACFSGG